MIYRVYTEHLDSSYPKSKATNQSNVQKDRRITPSNKQYMLSSFQ